MLGGLIGGIGGALKGAFNAGKAKKEAQHRKTVLMLSPWTGMSDPGASERPGVFQSMLGGVGAGLKAQQGIEAAGQAKDLKDAYLKNLGAQTKALSSIKPGATPWGGIAAATQQAPDVGVPNLLERLPEDNFSAPNYLTPNAPPQNPLPAYSNLAKGLWGGLG